jgi:hypothetical protein
MLAHELQRFVKANKEKFLDVSFENQLADPNLPFVYPY